MRGLGGVSIWRHEEYITKPNDTRSIWDGVDFDKGCKEVAKCA